MSCTSRKLMDSGPAPELSSYHIQRIPKGVYGESSKIYEETLEFLDAESQGCWLMALMELSDLYGAMEAWAAGHGFSMEDLKSMSTITKRAFTSGARKPT